MREQTDCEASRDPECGKLEIHRRKAQNDINQVIAQRHRRKTITGSMIKGTVSPQ
jgi:hypothetical protein